jgi:hypothetical protein
MLVTFYCGQFFSPLISFQSCKIVIIHSNEFHRNKYKQILKAETTFMSAKFYTHGSVHHNSILIRSNKTQQYAGIYLLQNHSTCFGCTLYPSSGVHKNVNPASSTGHSIWATTFLQWGLIMPHWRMVVAQILWPVPEAAVTVLCTPDDGCDGHLKHVQ